MRLIRIYINIIIIIIIINYMRPGRTQAGTNL